MLKARVLSLSILPYHSNIHLLMPSGQPFEVKAIDKRSIKIKLLPQLHIQRANPTSNRSCETSLEAHLVLSYGIQHFFWNLLHVTVNLILLEVHRRVHRLHHLLDGASDQRPDSIARN
uniref:Uncharacterized protein n=1 Tax=Opuntia streptacantha TaxID=393608 RepID=A0A7C8YSI6_OPUST